MKLICTNYLCILDTIDGGLREYHKNKIYNIHSFGDCHVVNGYPLKTKQIENNFITIYEKRNRIIKDILK